MKINKTLGTLLGILCGIVMHVILLYSCLNLVLYAFAIEYRITLWQAFTVYLLLFVTKNILSLKQE